jgi:hypothetical protein
MQCRHRFFVRHVAPRPADGPRAKANFRNLPTRLAKFTIFHFEFILMPINLRNLRREIQTFSKNQARRVKNC